MPPKSLEELEKEVSHHQWEIEQLKKDLPEYNAAMCQDIEEIRAEGKGTREMVVGMKTEIALMPGAIVKAMKEEGKGGRMEVKEWLLFALVIVSIVVALKPWG